MTDKNELFPFPIGSGPDENGSGKSAALPSFPTPAAPAEPPAGSPLGPLSLPKEPASLATIGDGSMDPDPAFSPAEVADLRRMLEAFRTGTLGTAGSGPGPAVPLPLPVVPPSPVRGDLSGRTAETFAAPSLPVSSPTPDWQTQLFLAWEEIPAANPLEKEIRTVGRDLLSELADPRLAMQVFRHFTGVFPLHDCLRHGTPDQRVFTLIALGDRFLQGMAGLVFPGRAQVLKAAARYLSEVSEACSFLTMEGEPFSPQFHERVPGASASGRMVREMRGFLVVRRTGNQVVRIGRVWT